MYPALAAGHERRVGGKTVAYDPLMSISRRRAHLSAAAAVVVLLAAGCDRGSGLGTDFTCEELEQERNVELVLCDDGETRIDRRHELVPATPEADQAD
jgi:hypothetical protein